LFWIFEGETIKSGYSICDFINDFTALCSEYLYETETGTFYKIERPKCETDTGSNKASEVATD
jgi:hypothetical protein